MNSNDYLIIEELHAEEIVEAYSKTLELMDVPEEFRVAWIDKYLENGREEE